MFSLPAITNRYQLRFAVLTVLAMAILAIPGAAHAQSWSWFVESDTDLPSDEVWEVPFANHQSFVDGRQFAGRYTGMNVSGTWGFKAFFADRDYYYILLESDVDAGAGAELYLITYDSMADVISNTQLSASFSQINLAGGYSVSGMAADGNNYYMLLETDDDQGMGAEFVVWTYNSVSDFLNNTSGTFEWIQLNLSGTWNMGGMAADGQYYYLIAEVIGGGATGSEFWIYKYASIADLIAHNTISADPALVPLNDAWSMGGLGISVPFFADGFESNSTANWDATVGN